MYTEIQKNTEKKILKSTMKVQKHEQNNLKIKNNFVTQKMHQTLITDYFPTIRRINDNDWEALISGQRVADFEFEEFDGDYWLTQAHTNPNFQRRGIGRSIMKEAVKYYGRVFASRASQMEHDDYDDSDTRYLTVEGAALVGSCVRHGILRPEWWFNPFQ